LKSGRRLELARLMLRGSAWGGEAVQPQMEPDTMHAAQPSLPARDDTLLGICQGLGEDFGFNPLWLRLALGASLLWNPPAVLAVYAGLGVLVLFSRLAFPPVPWRIRRAAKARARAAEAAGPAIPAEAEHAPEPLAIAA
jgi:phage shock protein PspC (stress-responsive transcriptional regulator)